MNAIDTSVAIAALLPWHEAHDASRQAASGAVIAAHALLECYSVLTRLPEPLSPEDAGALLRERFGPERIVVPPKKVQTSLVQSCTDLGIRGGAVYDALIAATVKAKSMTLVTRDRRASRIYELVGVDFRFV